MFKEESNNSIKCNSPYLEKNAKLMWVVRSQWGVSESNVKVDIVEFKFT